MVERFLPIGIHAQGRLVEDFLISQTDRFIHVLNAPPPAPKGRTTKAQGNALGDGWTLHQRALKGRSNNAASIPNRLI